MAINGRSSPAGQAAPRPSIELLGSSASTGSGMLGEDNFSLSDDETVDSVMAKLAIERRVQYGAEKMLDVIEQRSGAETGDSAQVKERITAQLEAANEHIRLLEAKLERLRGGSHNSTPNRSRRRVPKLNGYPSSTSLNPSLSSSLVSTTLASARKPLASRQGSTLTPERTGSSGQGGRRRSLSTGAESFEFGRSSDGSQRLVWAPGESFMSQGELSSEDENGQLLLETVRGLTSHMKDLVQQEHASKGKEPEKKGDAVRECLARMSDVLKKSRATRQAVKVDELMPYLVPALADSASTRRRSAAYRLLRHLIDRPNWGTMLAAGLEWPIVRTFMRDSKFVKEKEQALRLLRAVVVLPPPSHARSSSRSVSRKGHLRTPSGLPNDDIKRLLEQRVPISDGLIRAIVSAAENPDDPMRNVCVLTLIEIGIFDIAALVNSDAFRTLLLAFKDGPLELGPSITGLLLHLANQPSTRQYLLPGADVESVLVGLTEEYGKAPSRQLNKQVERVQHCVINLTLLLSSWTGYFVLCMDNFRAIRSLISTLHVPIPGVKDAFLNLLYTSLRIKSPTWKEAFLEGKRLTVYNRTQEAASQLHDDMEEEEPPHVLNLVDHYVALLLATFIEAGLLESLIALIEEDLGTLNRKATLLLGEVLQMGNRILPLQFAAKLQALPRLFAVAADFASPAERHLALSALSSIDSLNRNQSKVTKAHGRNYHGSSNIQDSLQRGQRQVQQVKLRMGLQIDDKQFIQMINDSGILLGRDHTKWNYDIVMDLIEGPLLNPKRLDEAIKATKFLRRLFQFFHPYNNRFSAVKRTRPNHKWVRLGCSLLETMLANPEGIRFLGEDKLLRQLAECFAELDPYVGMPNAQPVFARDRLVNSLTYGYFEMIGTLSKHSEGMKLLEKFRFFTCFYHLSEQRSRDDITRIIIECFDYSIDAHPRIVLSKALTSSYMETRLFATHHLGRLIHESPSLVDWGLQLMITQLYDTSMEVCEVAVMYLEDMCTDAASLEKVVQLRPTLEHLGDIGHPLFMRFVSTSVGFRYLHQTGYIERELEHWLTERNLLYVIETETWVTKTLRPFSTDTVEDYWEYDGTAPTHFFGELTKTPEGCQWLKNKGLVSEFCEIVRLHGMEPEDMVVMTNVKSVLWVLGNIGSTDGGLPFLEDEEIIDAIIEIAEQSPVLTMRGVAFFVIGLISSTRVGAELLEEYGWIATRTSLGMTTGLCLPNDLSRFVRIEPWHRPSPPTTAPLPPLPSASENEIISYIRNLSNYVLAAGAMNNLKRLRSRHPKLFGSLTLFHRAWYLICNNHYQAPVRRFILELFDISIEPDTLAALRRLDAGPPHTNGGGERVQSHSRKRSTSSPGPTPMFGSSPAGPNGPSGSLLNVRRRSRGLTTSDLPKAGFTPANEPNGEGEEDGRMENGGPKRVEGFATPPRRPMAVE